MRKYGVIFGGPSPEHEISILTGLQCERVLSGAGHEPTVIYWSREGEFFVVDTGLEASAFIDGTPKGADRVHLDASLGGGFFSWSKLGKRRDIELEAVLNCCHGGPGESGGLNAMMEVAGIPITGGPSWAAALGMDKLAFAGFAAAAGLRTLPRVAVTPGSPAPEFDAPYLVKPRGGGSSLGIQTAADWSSALDLVQNYAPLRQGAVAEPFLPDSYDLNLGFATWPEVRFSLVERPERVGSGIYDYEQKYLQGNGLSAAPREIPANIPDTMHAECLSMARTLIVTGGFRGLGRIDFLIDEETVYLNEVNSIPGAMGMYLWEPDIPLEDLLVPMLDEAQAHPPRPLAAAPAAREALRVASGISQKLLGNRVGGAR